MVGGGGGGGHPAPPHPFILQSCVLACFTASKDVYIFAFIPAMQGLHSSTLLKFFRDARAEAVPKRKESFLVQVVLSL